MDPMSPMEMTDGTGMGVMRRRGKKRKRKLHGVLYVRNLRTGVKSRFKAKCASRDDLMTDVLESLMLLYIDKPETVNDILRDVKAERRKTNRGKGG